jgi:hypothetical protein
MTIDEAMAFSFVRYGIMSYEEFLVWLAKQQIVKTS